MCERVRIPVGITKLGDGGSRKTFNLSDKAPMSGEQGAFSTYAICQNFEVGKVVETVC